MGTPTTRFSIPCRTSRLGLPGAVAAAECSGAGGSGLTDAMAGRCACVCVCVCVCECECGLGGQVRCACKATLAPARLTDRRDRRRYEEGF